MLANEEEPIFGWNGNNGRNLRRRKLLVGEKIEVNRLLVVPPTRYSVFATGLFDCRVYGVFDFPNFGDFAPFRLEIFDESQLGLKVLMEYPWFWV